MNRAIDSSASAKLEVIALARQVQELVARMRPEVTVERRHGERLAVPLLFRLTPLNSHREPVHDDAITVVGKDISSRGLSFYHEQPLTYRLAIVSLNRPDFGPFAAEIDVNWCRFTKPGWYESGGRLVRTMNPDEQPMASLPDTERWTHRSSLADGACC
jgi:hypothetical protein